MSESYCYSTNEEYFNGDCASREEAVRECVAENDLQIGDAVWTAKSVAFSPESHVNGDSILEHLGEAAFEHAGEAAEGWPPMAPNALVEDLERRVGIAIVGWLSEHNLHPKFWGVGAVEAHVVTASDLPSPSPDKAPLNHV